MGFLEEILKFFRIFRFFSPILSFLERVSLITIKIHKGKEMIKDINIVKLLIEVLISFSFGLVLNKLLT